jgi:tubulin polyglutamylase TTLL5
VGAAGGWYDFFPRTFAMPADYEAWREAATAEPETIWIQKPKRLAEGTDVSIVTDPDSVEPDEKWIVQEYLANPLLLPGRPYKHILRLYVLMTSLDPLAAFLYPNGPVKFASRPFGTSPAQLADPVIHITNPRVQRTNEDVPDPVRALDIPAYRAALAAAGLDDVALWRRIRSILTQTLIAHREPMLTVTGYICDRMDCCFELLGFDVLVDAELQPWVVECNMSPALGVRGAEGSPDREAQRRSKEAMVADTLSILGVGEDGFEVGYGAGRFAAEIARRGDYEVLFPGPDAPSFAHCYERLSAADASLIEVIAGGDGV